MSLLRGFGSFRDACGVLASRGYGELHVTSTQMGGDLQTKAKSDYGVGHIDPCCMGEP